jgi:hypothetical protein
MIAAGQNMLVPAERRAVSCDDTSITLLSFVSKNDTIRQYAGPTFCKNSRWAICSSADPSLKSLTKWTFFCPFTRDIRLSLLRPLLGTPKKKSETHESRIVRSCSEPCLASANAYRCQLLHVKFKGTSECPVGGICRDPSRVENTAGSVKNPCTNSRVTD